MLESLVKQDKITTLSIGFWGGSAEFVPEFGQHPNPALEQTSAPLNGHRALGMKERTYALSVRNRFFLCKKSAAAQLAHPGRFHAGDVRTLLFDALAKSPS